VNESKVFLRTVEGTGYPGSESYFSPSTRFPEYRFDNVSKLPNPIYDGFRSLLFEMGLDLENFGTGKWNPLGFLIGPGTKIVVKPNFVMHKNGLKGEGLDSLITNVALIRAICDYLFIAADGDCSIIVADAPLQNADFNSLIEASGLSSVVEFYNANGLNIVAKDLRLRISEYSGLGVLKVLAEKELKEEARDHTLVAVDSRSLHKTIESKCNDFRVTNYNPKTMMNHHSEGKHEYIISNDILDADLIVNVPKLKTHRKAGITCSLKNLVGINGHKDFLPHHTKGSQIEGGDEYLAPSRLKKLTSWLIDRRNTSSTRLSKHLLAILGLLTWQFSKLFSRERYFEGSWFGNDTIWRTVLDLNRILFYAQNNGQISNGRNSKKYMTIVDAVICGEGEGPLMPKSKALNYIIAGFNPAPVDLVASSLMGFDYMKIPTIRNSFAIRELPIVDFTPSEIEVIVDGKEVLIEELKSANFKPASGWKGHIEKY